MAVYKVAFMSGQLEGQTATVAYSGAVAPGIIYAIGDRLLDPVEIEEQDPETLALILNAAMYVRCPWPAKDGVTDYIHMTPKERGLRVVPDQQG